MFAEAGGGSLVGKFARRTIIQNSFCCVFLHGAETKAPAVMTDPKLFKAARAKAIFFIWK